MEKMINDVFMQDEYELALFTTFNFDIDFFEERLIFNKFNCEKINLYVDNNELMKSIKEKTSRGLGSHYYVSGVTNSFTKGSFHPKVVLMLSKTKAKLVVSSANLKISSYYFNKEIYNEFEITEENNQYINLIKSAIKFFEKLNEDSIIKDNDSFEYIKTLSYLNNNENEKEETYFLENTETSIIDQLTNIINKEDVTAIDIAVPYYDKELSAIAKIKELFNKASINLYIQNKTSSFDFVINDQKKIIKNENLIIFDNINEKNNFYHGKVFRFTTKEKEYILYGSSNCTNAALFKNSKEGNTECNILTTGKFDQFFKSFEALTPGTFTPITNKIKFETNKDISNYTFKNSEHNEHVTAIFTYKRISDLKIYFNEEEINPIYIKHNEETKTLHVTLSEFETVPNIYELKFQYENNIEIKHGWYLNRALLNPCKNNTTSYTFNEDNTVTNVDKYFEAQIFSLVNFINSGLNFQNVTPPTSYDNNISERNFDEVDNNDDNSNNYLEILDEDNIKRKIINEQTNSEKYYNRLRIGNINHSTNNQDNDNSKVTDTDTTKNSDTVSNKSIKAYEAEEIYAEKINRLIKHVLSSKYINNVSFDHLYNVIRSISEIMHQLKIIEKINIFNDETYIKCQYDLSSKLIDTFDTSINNNTKSSLIIYIISSILNNYSINHKTIESFDSELINKLNNKIKFKNNLMMYLNPAYDNSKLYNNTLVLEKCESYILKLFDSYIIEEFGKTYKIVVINNKVYMMKREINFSNRFKPPVNIVKLLKSFNNIYNIKDVIIIYFNKDENVAIKDIKQIYTDSRKYHVIIQYKDVKKGYYNRELYL